FWSLFPLISRLRTNLRYARFPYTTLFRSAVLDIKIPSADTVTFALYEAKCFAELQRLQQDEQTPTVVQRVQDYLEIQRGLMPSMAETAQALKIPARTLFHQLQQLDTSYKQISDEIIKDNAFRLIKYTLNTLGLISILT